MGIFSTEWSCRSSIVTKRPPVYGELVLLNSCTLSEPVRSEDIPSDSPNSLS